MKHFVLMLSLLILISIPFSGSASAYQFDFESGVPSVFSGGSGASASGYSGYGFGGSFYRSSNSLSLTLTGLTAHDSIDLDFFLAVIDSWDGSNTSVAPDYFNVSIDGNIIFHETFDNFSSSDQSYTAPAGGLLVRDTNLYGASGWPDSAYNMGIDSVFNNISHTSSSLTIAWYADGHGWQGGSDEYFAIDNIDVTLNKTSPTPEPATMLLLGSGILGLAGIWRKKRR